MNYALTRALTARPDQFMRKRSMATTLTGVVLAALLYALAIWAIVDFQSLRDLSQIEGDSGIYAVKADGAPYFALPFGLIFGTMAARWAAEKHGPWTRIATGTELRNVITVAINGDRAYLDSLSALVSTANPAVFTPLPRGSRGNIEVVIYAADADRIAYAIVADRQGTRAERRAAPPITVIEGANFDALMRAEATGQLVRPAGYTPLQGDTQ